MAGLLSHRPTRTSPFEAAIVVMSHPLELSDSTIKTGNVKECRLCIHIYQRVVRWRGRAYAAIQRKSLHTYKR